MNYNTITDSHMNKGFKWIFFLFIGLILIVLFVRPYYLFVRKTLNVSPFQALLLNDDLKTYDSQVNILVLGIAPDGSTHEGPNLSDSIIVANYNMRLNRVTTISIPRDVWSDTLRDKINSAYAYGEAKKKNGGFILSKTEVGQIVGLPIQYVAVIDFDQFKELIDYVGGIDVSVERSFTDRQFPITGRENDTCGGDPDYKCRYETISFKKGVTHMDGNTALKFVRSRHAEGDEGTDFAREARQQKVISAVMNKMISVAKKLDIAKFKSLYEIVDKLVRRDITNQQAAILARNAFLKGKFSMNKIVLNEDLFINPPLGESKYDGLWVLTPRNGSFDEIHALIQCRLSGSNCPVSKNKSK